MNPALKPVLVVLGWAALNAVLVLLMLVYGESALFIGMYGAAVGLTVLVAAAIFLGKRAPAGDGRRTIAVASQSGMLFALAAVIAGAGLIYGYWLTGFAIIPLLAALARQRKEVLPRGGAAASTEVSTLHSQRPESADGSGPVAKAVKATTATVVVTKAAGWWRRKRRSSRT